MRLRELNIGCVGGGTGMPSLIGGLKGNPWLRLSAVVTMFDSGGSSGQLRDELGVLRETNEKREAYCCHVCQRSSSTTD
jgi:2-phospho-L-lactate transferase/gluconeogenesis factor (CofD/UPF0052 family)